MRKLVLVCLFLSLIGHAFGKKYIVHTQDEFNSITSTLVAGDDVTIANGNYSDWAIRIKAVGTASSPITIHAQSPHGVVFSGDVHKTLFELAGSYITLSDIDFKRCTLVKANNKSGLLVGFRNSSYCKISNCVFSENAAGAQFMAMVIVAGTADHSEISNCSFIAEVDNIDVQVKIRTDGCPTHTLVQNNLFQNKNRVSWQPSNGGECVQIGQDNVLLGEAAANAIVRENRFINCNGDDEVVSNKSSGNQYIKNYFENCMGELVLRGGSNCVIDSNIFNGGRGIRICGTGQVVTNNKISNTKTGIRLMYGMAKGRNAIGYYIAASNCTIKNNRIDGAEVGVLVGENKNQNWEGKFDTKRYPSRTMQDVSPSDNIIDKNFCTNCRTAMEKN